MAGLFQSPFPLGIHVSNLLVFPLVPSGLILGTGSTSSLASLWFGAGHTAVPQGYE